MTSKELLLKDRDLTNQADAVTKAIWFHKFLIFVRAQMMQGEHTAEMLAGAKRYEEILLNITDTKIVEPPPIESGLNHDIDNPRAERKTKI